MKVPSLKEWLRVSGDTASLAKGASLVKEQVELFAAAGGLRVLAGLALAAALVVAVVHSKVQDAYRRADQSALRADSIEAVLDTTKVVHLVVNNDSVDVYRKRAVQHALEQDKLEKKLKSRAIQHAAMIAFMSGIVDSLSAPATADSADSVRSASFRVDSVPFHGNINVKIPRPPANAVAQVNIAVDTAHIGLSVRCGEPVSGTRPAEVAVSTDPWLKFRVSAVEQETRVCNPQMPTKPKKGVIRKYGPSALLVWLGYLLH
jgi:hypothetical protein